MENQHCFHIFIRSFIRAKKKKKNDVLFEIPTIVSLRAVPPMPLATPQARCNYCNKISLMKE